MSLIEMSKNWDILSTMFVWQRKQHNINEKVVQDIPSESIVAPQLDQSYTGRKYSISSTTWINQPERHNVNQHNTEGSVSFTQNNSFFFSLSKSLLMNG